MLYYGGIRFPRASFLGYYENVASSLAKLPRQLILVAAESAVIRLRWDPRLTDPAFAGSVSPYRDPAFAGSVSPYRDPAFAGSVSPYRDPAFAGSVSPYRASSRRPERYYADAPIRFDL
jgi:hypothetical protein